MHSFTLLSVLSLALSSAVLAAPDLSHRRQHRDLVQRQERPNMNNSWSEPPISSSSTTILPSSSGPASSAASSSAPSSSQPAATSSAVPTSSATSNAPAVSASATSAPADSSSAPPSSAAPSSAAPSSDAVAPSGVVSTISVPSSASTPSASAVAPSTVIRSSITSVTSVTRTVSGSASSSASVAAAGSDSVSSGGLSKTAIIAIAVVASVVGIAGIGFTLFRRWKLRPSNRFEKRLNAIDFAPKAGGYGGDDFFEKTHNRSASASSAERHRKALMAEEFESGPDLTAGIPDHDFTAGATYGMAGAGAGAGGYGAYNADPFAHTQAYDYPSYGEAEHGYPPQTYDQYGQPVPAAYDHPTQDHEHVQGQGYADLQRGNSDGSAHQHSHAQRVTSPTAQVYHDDLTFPESGQYLGRPTGGADGPYAQAAQYRAY